MKIGELAAKAGVNIQTIRYYERRNLLLPSSVSDSGYRHYQSQDFQKLQFIKQLQELGFTLNEIDELLELKAQPKSNCAAVKKKTAAKIKDVQEKIRSLKKVEAALHKVLNGCERSKKSVGCTFLDGLDSN